MDESKASECLKFLKKLKNKGKSCPDLLESINILKAEASTNGLDDATLKTLFDIVMTENLGSATITLLIKAAIPKSKISDTIVEDLITWLLMIPASVTILTTLLQWLVGCVKYKLINRDLVYIFYDPLFFVMLKQEKLEAYLAHLIYIMTKPDDVSRRQVLRLLKLDTRYKSPRKHIIALLSLFKSYKPEVVPEKIPSINLHSAWRPISENLQLDFDRARARILSTQAQGDDQMCCDWNVIQFHKTKKNQEPLVPSIRYLSIGSSIFETEIKKSIFDISDISDLGRYSSEIKLPCNATSLLKNVIGYHLLMYTDLKYQHRFMHNLYFTLWKSFIFEKGKYSNEEMDALLKMTAEFCSYMQNGISIVNYFINEYFTCCTNDYDEKLLSLIQWSSILPPELLQDYILKHLKIIFYSSSFDSKCKIIRTLRKLSQNLFITNSDLFEGKTFPFLEERCGKHLNESARLIQKLVKELTTAASNIHSYNSIMISEALSFYEQMSLMAAYSNSSMIVLPSPSITYGSFSSKSCVLLSKICELLLQVRYYLKNHKTRVSMKDVKWFITYIQDFVSALWFEDCVSERKSKDRYLLKRLSDQVVKNYSGCNLDELLSIKQHYAVLPFIFESIASGYKSSLTSEDALIIANYYYKYLNQFINAFGRD
ncbi:hypothetical protein QAD02_009783 [Eretmocerus hayati]|uniref:Uncharacterized protein n=1 Tax=Eretmocerus hayati TaxID=131215 RepID=A0ACC2NAD4_9HYME|nr:hypothetical protein QAD02_009783 [Eretmocerus hayati]